MGGKRICVVMNGECGSLGVQKESVTLWACKESTPRIKDSVMSDTTSVDKGRTTL